MPTKIDDKTFEDFGLREVVGHRNPSTPEFTQRIVAIPGMNGVWGFGHQIGTRTFEIPLKHLYNDMYKRQRFLNELVAFFFNEYGQPKEFKLIFDYEPDKYYLVKVSGAINPDRLLLSNSFSLSLVANKPNKHFLIDADEIRMGSHIPILSHVSSKGRHSFKVTNNQTILVINDGTKALKPSISISGSATSLTIKNTNNNHSFSMSNILSEKPVIIEGTKYLVTEGGVDALSKLVGRFIELIPGENYITITGVDVNISINFKYKFQYM
ncbi:distal tail protein Dit [Niallia taxi]|uniref:distal tail protein Dit n=1 Tax=Niallia taxi TaxID=2499688 RepID=UPI00317DE306